MSPIFSSHTRTAATVATYDRAKERLYVVCQCGGWLSLLGMQVFFSFVFAKGHYEPRVQNLALVTMVVLLGWLISHFSRGVAHRWRWKELSWRRLAPLILLVSALQSALWSAIGHTYTYGVPGIATTGGPGLPLLFVVTWVNGMVIFTGWWCVYFFYHLFDRYNSLQIEQLRLASEVKEAELRALKSQVNPHFIFNALNSLRALIDEDPARARQAVTQLANLLRYSLQSAQAETVPFEDELRVVSDYLALEQVRHEERLRLRLDVAPETLSMRVPPLILQTLVENAVKYGISPRPEGGEIGIEARVEQGVLRLRVTNPGELAPHFALQPDGRSTGLGLKNAAERLRLSFGDRAQLQVRGEAALVVAEVLVPAGTVHA
jgi:anti-sigma regulatory factor (Ser/Thr protein kinase)